jgi:hypothetical protein
MLGNPRLARAVLGVLLIVSVHRVHAQETDAGSRPDGTYSARMKAGPFDSARASFVQRGSSVVGFMDAVGPVYCFQGTLNGDAIQVQQARERKEDKAGNVEWQPYRILPVEPPFEDMWRSLRITGSVKPGVPNSIEIWSRSDAELLEQCVTYFAADEPPCGDPELRATIPAPGTTPTYPPTTRPICTITDEPQTISGVVVPGGVCSVAAVFEVMSTTAVAIAPFNAGERQQEVIDCGVLRVKSAFTPNLIRPQIDKAHHRVTNSTLRGHVFHPGQVVREIVELDGQVQVATLGASNARIDQKLLNDVLGRMTWDDVDEELRRAFAKDVTSRTAEGYKRSELHDGTYIAMEAFRPMHGAIFRFRKRGDHVVGTSSDGRGLKCYIGTITPTEIHVKDIVEQNEDYTTKAVSFSPISEGDRSGAKSLRFVPPPDPRPTPWKLLDPPPSRLMDETKDLNDCSRHFGLPEEEPPPCGDDALKGALRYGYILNEDAKSDTVCEMTGTNGCTAENIFALMLNTPDALAPLVDRSAVAQDCGTLSVRVPGGGAQQVRIEIDPRYHVVNLYTLPGHPFFPATIVRRIEESVGYVWINTHAWGTEATHTKAFSDAAAAYVWEGPNKALKAARSGGSAIKKPASTPKKTGSATKKKP